MFRTLILYPLLALAAAALVHQSLSFAPPPIVARPQDGLRDGAWSIFGPEALATVQTAANQHAYVARNEARAPTGLRLAIKEGEGAPRGDETGALLLVQPDSGARFAGDVATLVVTTRPMLYPTAPELAATLHAEGAVLAWATAKTAVIDGKISFTFPVLPGPLTAIGLRPIAAAEGDAIAIEIAEIRVRPGLEPPPPPPAAGPSLTLPPPLPSSFPEALPAPPLPAPPAATPAP